MQNNNQPVERITWSEARADLADLINRVLYKRERLVITRHGKDVAELVPIGSEAVELTPREAHPEYFVQR